MTEPRKNYVRPLDIKHGHVDMAHGSGGRAMAQLIEELFAKYLGNEYLAQGDDGALLPNPGGGKLVMATDSHSLYGWQLASSSKKASNSPIWRVSCKAWRRRRRVPGCR